MSRLDPNEPFRSKARPLSEWLREKLTPPSVVLPFVALDGCATLFSGREKVGKSTFICSLVAVASRGEEVLGEAIPRAVWTLYYTLDEKAHDTARRLEGLGAHPERVILNDQPRSLEALKLAIAADLKAHEGVTLIVVDTLSKILSLDGIEVNDATKVEKPLAELIDKMREYPTVASVFLYHTGKLGKTYRGSTAIGATFDELLTLRRRGEQEEDDFDEIENEDDGRRLLVQNGRNLQGRVHLIGTGGQYRLYSEAATPLETRIRAVLEAKREVGSRSELAKLAKGNRQQAFEIIGRLVRAGTIAEDERGLRFQVSPSAASPEPTSKPHGSRGSARFSGGGTDSEPKSGTVHDAPSASVPVPPPHPHGNRNRQSAA